MAMFTEEVGVLIAAARDTQNGRKRSELVREGRLINKSILKVDNDIRVTNSTVDSLLAQRLLQKRDGSYVLTLAGAQGLLSLQKRLAMLAELLNRTGKAVAKEDEGVIIDLTEEVLDDPQAAAA